MNDGTDAPADLYEPEFPEAWDCHSLYGLAVWINGMAFRDIHFASSGTPVIKIAEVKNGLSGQTKFTRDNYEAKYLLRDGDMLFCWSGQPETSIDTYWWRGGSGWLNQHIFKVLPRKELVDRGFFFQLLKYLRPNFVRIARNKQTTGLGHVTKADLQRLQVALPPAEQQRGIAAILGALDDKIESNRTLRRMIWDLLESEYNSFTIQETRQPLRNVMRLVYGKALPATKRAGGHVPVYGSNGITGWHDAAITDGPTIVVGRKGSIGEVHWSDVPVFPIDTTFYVEPLNDFPLLACYFALRSAGLRAMNSDSAIPGLNRDRAMSESVRMPSIAVATDWAKRSGPSISESTVLAAQEAHLVALRDALIPALMSGRIHVPQGQRRLEGTVA
jgi:type I restriction enzyme S subunit